MPATREYVIDFVTLNHDDDLIDLIKANSPGKTAHAQKHGSAVPVKELVGSHAGPAGSSQGADGRRRSLAATSPLNGRTLEARM